MSLTKAELKKRVLKHLNEHGDTFVDFTPVILNTGIDQTHIKYLLDELQTDSLIILSKANPHLNSIGANGHVLTAASNMQARITPQGRDYVKQHFASSSWLDYLEKHPIIRIILIVGGVAGLIALIVGSF
jgi:hypothetical protein